MYTQEDVLAYVNEENVTFIRLAYFDIYGHQKNISILPDELPRAFAEGISFDASAIAGFGTDIKSDLFLMPDPSTLSILPWRSLDGSVVRMYCDIQYPDGTPFELDTRYLLKQAEQYAKEQGIAFKVDPTLTYYIGLRAPDGEGYSTTATVTNGESVTDHSISSASDLYYKITPSSDGYIVVKNSGNNMLAITKLRTTGGEAADIPDTQNLFAISDMPALMSYVAEFDSLPVVGASDDTGIELPEEPEEETTDEVTEVPEESQTGNVVIENPDSDSQQNANDQNNAQNAIRNLIDRIFSGIRSWFK